jgi:predicted tellurium resistance membrane protein TerC
MTLITIGLVVSVPIIMAGATVIASVLDRFPWVGMVGAGLIGWIAGGVIADDGRVDQHDASGHFVEIVQPGTTAAWLDSVLPQAEIVCAVIGAAAVLLIGLYLSRRKAARADKAHAMQEAEKAHIAQD